VLEGMLRYVPGVVGKDESVASDSFTGPLVDYPEYTEPLEWHGKQVPEIIRSGNHEKIATWRREQAIGRTLLYHFDWLRSWVLAPKLKQEILAKMPPHYVVLMHDEVHLKDGRIGTSSVTSIDIHDIARSATTYGFKRFFLLTPLEDQTKIVQTLLDFWFNRGQSYNGNRSQAVQLVTLVKKLDEVVEAIERETGKKPLLIATSAREHEYAKTICYNDQELIWQQQRPVLLVFGTASGLADQVLQRCDYVLAPLYGLAEFNHLSVRSAAAVVFDRWLGLQSRERGR
jgi:tRNA (guanine37-N1)-methyltransferase